MPSELAFRDADPSEDDELARVLYNAFQPIWNHNWFQCLDEILPTIPSDHGALTNLQARRLAFYRAWLSINRAYGGDILVAHTPTPHDSSSENIAAVVLLLPPHKRPSLLGPLTLWRTNFLQAVFGLGLRGFWRTVVIFEGNVGNMISADLKKRNIGEGKETNLLFVQGCVRNPMWKGEKGPARKLLDWGIQRWWDREVRIPVWLDCTTGEGERAYAEIGFELVGDCMVKTGCDEKGVKLKAAVQEDDKSKGRDVAKQRVMVRVPEL